MLQNLRDNSKGVISGILIGFLVIIFAISGSEALFNSSSSDKGVVSVNGEDITEMDIARASENYKRQLTSRYGESLPADYLSDENIRQPVINNLIERKVVTLSARDAGMVVSDENLNQQILATPQFQQKDGGFDSVAYQQILRSAGYTPATFKKVLADDAIVRQLTSGVIDSSFITPAELSRIVALSFQTRDFSYATISANNIGESVSVDDSEIESYYNANTASFVKPDQVAVDYIDLNVSDLMSKIDVTDEELHEQYKQNVAAFVAAPERQAAHILIEDNDPEKVAEVSKKLAAGEDFAQLANTYSDDMGSREQGGDVGFSAGEAFPEEFEEKLATLKVGEVSGPVKTEAGTHFIKLLSERGTKAPTFEEERTRLADQLKRAAAERQFVSLLEKLREESYNAENLTTVAKDLGLESQNTGLFSRNAGKGIASEPQVADAAFSDEVVKQNNSSEVIELSPERVVVVKKTDFKPSYTKPLEEVKDQVAMTVRKQKIHDLLLEKAKALKNAVASGESLESAAKANGYEVKALVDAKRTESGVDRQVLNLAFTMAKPQSDSDVVVDTIPADNGDLAVVALSKVTLGGQELPAEQKQSVATQLATISGESEFKDYQQLLRDQAEIKR